LGIINRNNVAFVGMILFVFLTVAISFWLGPSPPEAMVTPTAKPIPMAGTPGARLACTGCSRDRISAFRDEDGNIFLRLEYGSPVSVYLPDLYIMDYWNGKEMLQAKGPQRVHNVHKALIYW
jgi:hypothetical protein